MFITLGSHGYKRDISLFYFSSLLIKSVVVSDIFAVLSSVIELTKKSQFDYTLFDYRTNRKSIEPIEFD